jgi:hypothetical protein
VTRDCRTEVLRELATLADSGIEITADTLRVMATAYEKGTASASPSNNDHHGVDDSVLAAAAIADIKSHSMITYAYLSEANYDAVLAQLDYMRERCSWIESVVWRRITGGNGTT